ncbi:hypothetical protein [Sphingobacterium sp.]|uniref:hypothetical protein n=1 Tax=Sphingobacterium sp. TaxID=341027 RepID=UPI002898F860|nr:hypothetical protein [Sphingobacterium sp.]
MNGFSKIKVSDCLNIDPIQLISIDQGTFMNADLFLRHLPPPTFHNKLIQGLGETQNIIQLPGV